jgi:hypothetical protein
MKPSWNPQDRKVFKIISTPLFHKIFFKKVIQNLSIVDYINKSRSESFCAKPKD